MKKHEMIALEQLLTAAMNNVHNDQNPEQKLDSLNLLRTAHTILWRSLGKQKVGTRRDQLDSDRIIRSSVDQNTLKRTGFFRESK